ncbi:MAG: hypothetical protein J6R80_05070 [Kiritimatiellae bacterium]|nr:hypothetical protein [Kiritimatiellia bacterium]
MRRRDETASCPTVGSFRRGVPLKAEDDWRTRASSLFSIPYSLFPVPYSLLPEQAEGKVRSSIVIL